MRLPNSWRKSTQRYFLRDHWIIYVNYQLDAEEWWCSPAKISHHRASEIRSRIGPGNAPKQSFKLLPATAVLKIVFHIAIPNRQNRRRCGIIKNQKFWGAQIRWTQLPPDVTRVRLLASRRLNELFDTRFQTHKSNPIIHVYELANLFNCGHSISRLFQFASQYFDSPKLIQFCIPSQNVSISTMVYVKIDFCLKSWFPINLLAGCHTW